MQVSLLYAGVFAASMVFPSLATIFKERIFQEGRRSLDNKKELDLFVVNSFGSASQVPTYVAVMKDAFGRAGATELGW